MLFLYMFPLLALPLFIYNILMLFGLVNGWREIVFDFNMISGGIFSLNATEIFTIACLFLLFIEIVKATRSSNRTVVDHLLSTLVFIICLVEFLLVDYASTAVFLILTLISLTDVIAGYTISIRTAAWDIEFY